MNVVQKYGGTSVDTPEKIKAIAKSIAEIKKNGDQIVIVASAMGSTTDELISMAKNMGDNVPKRELDALLSTGEQRTVALMAIALENLGIPAVSMTGFQSGFVTNDNYNNAMIKEINTTKVKEILGSGKIAVVAGFQGISETGDITTLGRGGSDLTAVAIAADLGWDCEIYTDVDCLFTLDPAINPKAKPIHKIAYDEMMEMSNLGAAVLETRSVELAKKYDVKLFLGRSLEKDKSKGTYIMDNKNLLVEDMPVTGITVQENISIFTIKNIPNNGKAVAECFKLLEDLHINVDMISQHITGNGTCQVSFSCTEEQGKALKSNFAATTHLKDLEVDQMENLAMISLIGVGMATHSGVASKFFSVLAEENIIYYNISTSEISISMTVDMAKKSKAAIALADAFEL